MSRDASQDRINEKLFAKSEQKSKKGLIIGIIAAIAVIILVIVLVLLLRKPEEKAQGNVVVTPDNVEEIIAQNKDQKAEYGNYIATMNSNWVFENGSSASSNAYVENVGMNSNDVYFDVKRSDNGEVIMKSPVIPVGSSLNSITLDSELSAGTYDCVLTYHLLDDDGNPISSVQLKLTITVEH